MKSPSNAAFEAWPGYQNLLFELEPDGGQGEFVRKVLDEEGWRWARKVARESGGAVKDATADGARLKAENSLLRAKLGRAEERARHLRVEAVSHIRLTSLEASRGNLEASASLHWREAATALLARQSALSLLRKSFTSLRSYASLCDACSSIPPPPRDDNFAEEEALYIAEKLKSALSVTLAGQHDMARRRYAFGCLLRRRNAGCEFRAKQRLSDQLCLFIESGLRRRFWNMWVLARSDPIGEMTADQMLRGLSIPSECGLIVQHVHATCSPMTRFSREPSGFSREPSLFSREFSRELRSATSTPRNRALPVAACTPLSEPRLTPLNGSFTLPASPIPLLQGDDNMLHIEMIKLQRAAAECERQYTSILHESGVQGEYIERLETQLGHMEVLVEKQKDVSRSCEGEIERLREELRTEKMSVQYQLGSGIRRQVEELTGELASRNELLGRQKEKIKHLEMYGVGTDQRRRNAAAMRRRLTVATIIPFYAEWQRHVTRKIASRRLRLTHQLYNGAEILLNKNNALTLSHYYHLLFKRNEWRRSLEVNSNERTRALNRRISRLRQQTALLVDNNNTTTDTDTTRKAYSMWIRWVHALKAARLKGRIVRLKVQSDRQASVCNVASKRDILLRIFSQWCNGYLRREIDAAHEMLFRLRTQCTRLAFRRGRTLRTEVIRFYFKVWAARGRQTLTQRRGVNRMERSWFLLLLSRYYHNLLALAEERRELINTILANRATKVAEPTRFQDPTTGNRIVFSLTAKGLRYTVNGEARPLIRSLALNVSATLTFPGVHPRRGITIPVEDLHVVLPRLRELVNSTTMEHNLGMLQPLEERLYLDPETPSRALASPVVLASPASMTPTSRCGVSPARSRMSSHSPTMMNTSPWVPPPGNASPVRARGNSTMHRTPRLSM